MDVGNKLRELRKQLNITTTELADRSTVSQSFISNIERNASSPTVETLHRLLSALGVTLQEFFMAEDEPHSAQLLHFMQLLKKLPPDERVALLHYLEKRLKNFS